jgi:hypothetical protein
VRGSNPGRKSFSFPKCPDRLCGPTQPPAQWVPGSYPEVTRQLREADHSPPHSAEVKNEWSFLLPSIHLHGADRDNLTFIFLSKCKRSTLLPSQEQTPPLQTKETHSSETLVPTYTGLQGAETHSSPSKPQTQHSASQMQKPKTHNN